MTTYETKQIREKLEGTEWSLNDEGLITRDYVFKDFAHAMLFANAVGHLAEVQNHHPDLLIHGYKNVTISMMSHDVSGITDRDFKLVAAIDGLPLKK